MAAEKMAFSTATWVTMISMIVGGVSANLMLIYSMAGSLQTRMDILDDKWQTRMIAVTQEIKKDINSVKSQIPPTWFREMVDANRAEIDQLEDEFTRDFVRKEELEALLESIRDR